jgi:hypothetical protein
LSPYSDWNSYQRTFTIEGWSTGNFIKGRLDLNRSIEEVFVNSLSTSYLTEKPQHDLVKVEFVYLLIQLINYIKSLKSSSKYISMGDRTYQTFQFRVSHFLEFIGKLKNNRYQIRKLVEFLESLQEIKPILDCFSDGSYLKVEQRGGTRTPFLSISIPLARKVFELSR